MKITIEIDDESFGRLARLADVLGVTVERYIAVEGMDWMVEGMEGNVADNLVCRIWDTLEEAQTAATKADALDETAYMWYFFRQPDGRILVEADDLHIVKIEAAGNELVMQGQSADWKVASVNETLTHQEPARGNAGGASTTLNK